MKYRWALILRHESLQLIGRDGVIRTHDPLHPMQVRYQAALRPDKKLLYQFEFLAIEL